MTSFDNASIVSHGFLGDVPLIRKIDMEKKLLDYSFVNLATLFLALIS